MENAISNLESLQNRFQVKSILARVKNKSIEITIIAKAENKNSLIEEARALAQLPNAEFKVYEPEDFFGKFIGNDAKIIEMLINSEAYLDNSNFISPLKKMAEHGKHFVQDNFEAGKACERLTRIEQLKQESVRLLFSSMLLSASAALLARGHNMPSAKEMPEYLKECFVKDGLLEKKYITICERIIEANDKPLELWEFSQLSYEAEIFVERMKTFVR